jgi:hypothetical protein
MLARRRDSQGGALDTRGGAFDTQGDGTPGRCPGICCFGLTGRMVVKCTRVWAGPGVGRVWTTVRVIFHALGRAIMESDWRCILFGYQHFRAVSRRSGQPSDGAQHSGQCETFLGSNVSFRLILSHPLLLIWMVLIMSREPERGAYEGRACPRE